MRRLVALVVLLAACGGNGATTTTAGNDSRTRAAEEFAVSADRALDGTRFADLDLASLAAILLDLCGGTGSVTTAVAEAVSGLEAPAGDAGDDAILTEVLMAGVVEICPERAAADVAAAFMASVRFTVNDGAGVEVTDDAALIAGLSGCAALDAGTPDDALVTIAAALFGVEATVAELLAGAIDTAQAVTVGAVLASAVAYLCPEHTDRVTAYLSNLGGPA